MTKTLEEYADIVLNFIERSRVGVSFVEIESVLREAGLDTDGDNAIDVGKNIVVWAGMSQEFVDVMVLVHKSRKTEMDGTSTVLYIVDGKFLTLPVAQRPPKSGYKELHWAPAILKWIGGA